MALPLFLSQHGLSICGIWPFILNIGGPFTFFLNMAFQFVAFDHSFSTLVVLPLFSSTWPFNLWPFTIHSQHWWPFNFFFSTWPFYFVPLTIQFATLVAFPLFSSIWPFILWSLTIHSQHWWPSNFLSIWLFILWPWPVILNIGGLSFCGLWPFIPNIVGLLIFRQYGCSFCGHD